MHAHFDHSIDMTQIKKKKKDIIILFHIAHSLN